jgi:glutamate dehydrogenase (NAD(P)+)
VREHKSIAGYPSGKEISREEFFQIKNDIFIPAALENQIGEAEAKMMDCKVVVEGANGPCSPEGEQILLDRGIQVIPDVLANSGGVTVSYYEWVQNKRAESWDLEEVDSRLETSMKRVHQETVHFARTKNIDLRLAAYGLALQRISAVYRERDIFP